MMIIRIDFENEIEWTDLSGFIFRHKGEVDFGARITRIYDCSGRSVDLAYKSARHQSLLTPAHGFQYVHLAWEGTLLFGRTFVCGHGLRCVNVTSPLSRG